MLSMGTLCSMVGNCVIGSPPTRWVGESGVMSSGYNFSRCCSSFKKLVVFIVGNFRIIFHIILSVMVSNGIPKLLYLFFDR